MSKLSFLTNAVSAFMSKKYDMHLVAGDVQVHNKGEKKGSKTTRRKNDFFSGKVSNHITKKNENYIEHLLATSEAY